MDKAKLKLSAMTGAVEVKKERTSKVLSMEDISTTKKEEITKTEITVTKGNIISCLDYLKENLPEGCDKEVFGYILDATKSIVLKKVGNDTKFTLIKRC